MVRSPSPSAHWSLRPAIILRAQATAASLALSLLTGGCAKPNEVAIERATDPPDAVSTDALGSPGPSSRPVVTPTAVNDLQAAFKRAIAAASPAVVSVYSTKTITQRFPRGFGGPGDPFFEFFGPPRGAPRQFEQHGLGSGFIVDTQGHVVTNNHVIDGASEIRVKLADGRQLDATLVGADPPSDLAVLKIEAEGMQPVELGSSAQLEVGRWVLAVGNPFGLPRTVSAGIVSAIGRANVGIVDYEDFIQTDAAVNPGNSGGPLIDLEGRVVGINTAIASRGGGNDGIAFAIPIDMARTVIEQLLDSGVVTRGHLGVLISKLDPEMAGSFGYDGDGGILVQEVTEGSPADRAGVRNGDIILELDGEPVDEVAAFRSTIARRAPGSRATLTVWRGSTTLTIEVQLDTLDAKTPRAAAAGPPKLGITLADLDPERRRTLGISGEVGVEITSVQPGSPAARAGLRAGDVLEQVGSTSVHSAREAVELIGKADLGKGLRLRYRRDGNGRFVFIRGD